MSAYFLFSFAPLPQRVIPSTSTEFLKYLSLDTNHLTPVCCFFVLNFPFSLPLICLVGCQSSKLNGHYQCKHLPKTGGVAGARDQRSPTTISKSAVNHLFTVVILHNFNLFSFDPQANGAWDSCAKPSPGGGGMVAAASSEPPTTPISHYPSLPPSHPQLPLYQLPSTHPPTPQPDTELPSSPLSREQCGENRSLLFAHLLTMNPGKHYKLHLS